MSCDAEKEVVIYLTQLFYITESQQSRQILISGLLNKQQFSGKQVQVLEYERTSKEKPSTNLNLNIIIS